MLVTLQEGIDIAERPFAKFAEAHQIGAVFDSRGFGYFRTLYAVNIPVSFMERVAVS